MNGLRDRLRDPVAWAEAIQLLKTAVACVIAWILAAELFDLPQPFLAPWAALLVVHATVYRTFSRGAQQVAAAVLGVVLAWAVGNLLGLDPVAIGVLLLTSLLVGQLPMLRSETTTVAATALVVLATGYSDEDYRLVLRLFDTAIGIGVGLGVNLLIWPPLRDRSAALAIGTIDSRIGVLLRDMAAELRPGPDDEAVQSWMDRTGEIDEDIDRAWGLLRHARESGRLNPRGSARGVRRRGEWGDLLTRLEQTVAEIRSMCRTLAQTITDVQEWEPDFRDRWIDILDDTGRAIILPDPDRVGEVRERLRALASDLSTANLSALHWPEYGGLIVDLRNIGMSMDVVAKSKPITVNRSRIPFRE